MKKEKGFTLIELTVVLAVLVILAFLLTPSILKFINDSRIARAQQDVKTIAGVVMQFYKDTGFFPRTSDSVGGGPGVNVVDMLVGPGNAPVPAPNPVGDSLKWVDGTTDTFENQFIKNTPLYRLAGSRGEAGWGGPYFTSELRSDPWGNRYAINSTYLSRSLGLQDETGAEKKAVYIISAGSNGTVDTPFTQFATAAEMRGDDIGFRVQ